MPTPARGSGRRSRSRVPTGPGRARAGTRGAQRRSAAARAAAAPPASAPSSPDPQRRSRLTGRSALLFVVLAVLLVSYASSMRAWFDQHAHINELEQQIASDRAAVERLTEEKRRWNDPAYLEAQARARFGYVMPGEIGYRVIDENGEPLGGTVELSEPVPTGAGEDPAWWQDAWGSVQAAGADPDEVEEDSPARFIGPKGNTR